ncbi:uncharacterized protein [Nicotiana sylvestris]|uniref:uncharacterized protein n=1 Tax=Nicotiana sylvestris TaxID=4096 RepID=UPI00388C6F18
MEFGIEPEQLHEPFSVSTLVGEYITAARVYRGCVIMVLDRDTTADLIQLGMVNFDVIMGMDWLYSSFGKLDCHKLPGILDREIYLDRCDARHAAYINSTSQNGTDRIERAKGTTEGFAIKGQEDHVDHQGSSANSLATSTKAVRLHWSDACERRFRELKSRLTTPSVLALPEGTEGFVVYCDASRIGIGCELMQHSKANVVADALSRKSMGSLAHLEAYQRPLAQEVHQLASFGVHLADSNEGGVIMQNRVELSLLTEVKEKQFNDPLLAQLKEGIHKYKTTAFSFGMNDGSRKMHHDLKEVYWWNNMKKNVADFVAKCLNCHQVKAEHQRPHGLAQSIEIQM